MARKKKDKGIRLSEKHGVNPSIIKCLLCGGDVGIALLGKLKDDAEAPKEIYTGDICDDCKKKLEEEKVRCFVDLSTGRYVKIPDDGISKEYLDKVGDLRYIPQSTEVFDNVFCSKEDQ